jgi:iron complex outermembrane receptor protein
MFKFLVFLLSFTCWHFLLGQQTDTSNVFNPQRVHQNQFNKGLVNSTNQALFGQLPGMMGSKNGANPNQDINFTYRGINTMDGNLEPQNYIDNIPVIDNFLIDPLLMESSQIQNNSHSAAIGLFSGSGVLQHNTREGFEKGLNIKLDQQMGVEHYVNPYDVLTADEYLRFTDGLFNNRKETVWYDEVSQLGLSSVSFAEITYQSEKIQAMSAYSYRTLRGTQQETGFDQSSLIGKVRISPLKWLSVEGTVIITDRESDYGDEQIWHGAFAMNPTYGPQDFSQYFNLFGLPPTQLMEAQKRTIFLNQDLFSGSITINPIENLSLQSQVSKTNYSNNDVEIFDNERLFTNQDINSSKDWLRNWNEIKYSDKIFNNSRISTSIFHEFQKIEHYNSNFWERENREISNPQNFFLSTDTVFGSFTTNAIGFALSFQNERLNFNGTYKNEISSNYGVNAGRASFFGADLSYSLFRNFRVVTGISQLGLMPTIAGLSKGSIRKIYFGYNPTDFEVDYERVENPDLEWEKNLNLEVGIETSLFNNKLNVSGVYYHQKSYDFIGQDTVGSIPAVSGSTYNFRNFTNYGEIHSQGIELIIQTSKLKLGRINYHSSTNINFRSSKFTDLSGSDRISDNQLIYTRRFDPYMFRTQEGQQVATIYAPEFLGVDDEGQWILSTDNVMEYPKTGNGLPSWIFGSYHNFNLKSWSVEFMLEGAFGHSQFNEARFFYQTIQSNTWNVLRSSEQLINMGLSDSNFYSDFFVENAGYVRMNYVSISKEWDMKSNWINNITAYFIINNLFTLTNYTGSDPAVSYRQNSEQYN